MTEDAHELVCGGCGGPRNVPDYAYCRDCKNAYQRRWRKKERARLKQIEAALVAASYGKDVSRETETLLPKRSKG